jgi:hypothetical protein
MIQRLTSSCNTPLPEQTQEVECTPDKKIRPMTPQLESPSGGELSPWPQITPGDSCQISAATPPAQKQRAQVDRSRWKPLLKLDTKEFALFWTLHDRQILCIVKFVRDFTDFQRVPLFTFLLSVVVATDISCDLCICRRWKRYL